LQIKTKNVSCHTADSKPVKQEVNGTVICSPEVFPGQSMDALRGQSERDIERKRKKQGGREKVRKRGRER